MKISINLCIMCSIAIAFFIGLVLYPTFFLRTPLKVTCSSFSRKSDAQKLFMSNMEKYKSLDHDRNGTACEDYKYN